MKFLLILTFTLAVSNCFGQSSEGVDFWFSFLEHRNPNDNNMICFVSSRYNTSGTVSIPGKSWSKTFSIEANIITKIELPASAETIGNEKISNNAVHVTTEKISSVYIHQYRQFRAEACLVLPVSTIGRHYYTMSYFGGVFSGIDYPSEFLVVGTEDSTVVDIVINEESLSGKPKGSTITILLNKGETFQVQGKKGVNDMTGSYISSQKPVAVFSGNKYTKIPTDCKNRDNLIEQMTPVETWGKQFVSIPFKQQNGAIMRIMASRNNTVVDISSNTNTTQYTIDAGEIVEYEASSPSYIESTDPITVAQFMKGSNCNGTNLGDPAMLMLNSLEQTRDTVTLFSSNLEDIKKKYISIITFTDNVGNVTYNGVTLTDLPEPIQAIQANPDYSYLSLQVIKDNHLITSVGCGVIVYGYGYGNAESYAYSGGATFSNINEVPIPDGGCLNEDIEFDSQLPKDRYCFNWNLGDGTNSNLPEFNHSYTTLGTYNVTLIITDKCLSKQDTFYKDLIISLRKQVVAGDNIEICEGEDTRLHVSDSPNSSYQWNGPLNFKSEEQHPQIINTLEEQSGFYTVVGIEHGCATYPDTVELLIRANPTPELGPDLYVCPDLDNTSFTITPGEFVSYEWSDLSTSSTITISKKGLYKVTVENEYHCTAVDSLLTFELCPSILYIPNVFNPSLDNDNGQFGVFGKDIHDITLSIYDRWGNNVFQTTDINNKWDGTFKGKDLNPGVFVWLFSFTGQDEKGNQIKKEETGDLLLAR